MSTKKIAVLAGDGIGKEVIPQALSAVRAVGAGVEFTEFDWGVDRYLRDGVTVPVDGFSLLAGGFDAVLVGAFGDSRVKSNIHAREILLGLRFQLDLYANVRPVKLLDRLLLPAERVRPRGREFHDHTGKYGRHIWRRRRSFQARDGRQDCRAGGRQYSQRGSRATYDPFPVFRCRFPID